MNTNTLEQMVGKENHDIILIDNVEATALIDSGSQISTITEEFLESFNPKPRIFNLKDLNLDVKVAGGYSLPYIGLISVQTSVPFIKDEYIDTLMLVVPQTEHNRTVPVIIGKNVINRLKAVSSDDTEVTDGWKTGFSSICNKQVGVVKTTNRIVLQPLESKVVTGFVRKAIDVDAAITEPAAEDVGTSRVIVCPRVVELNKPGTSARVPVRVCIISAKPVTIPAKTPISELIQVEVLRSADITSEHKETISARVNQQQATPLKEQQSPSFDLSSSCLSETEKEHAQKFLSKWQHIFSSGPLDLGHTHTVKHEINLEDEKPFKEPYRHIPPALFQEVRQHLKEMLQIGAIRNSSSPFSSNVVLVRKKDGSLRFCIDYRKLNQRTRKDAYAIPRIDDNLHLLAGANISPH